MFQQAISFNVLRNGFKAQRNVSDWDAPDHNAVRCDKMLAMGDSAK
jgi:hypothetical protein